MCHRIEISLSSEPASVRQARHWAGNQLAGIYEQLPATTCDQPDAVADDVEIVVSELVSNAIQARTHRLDLALEAHHRSVRIEVTDDAPGLPTRHQPSADASRGRGLAIVHALATHSGVNLHHDAKTVWAELPVPDGTHANFDCGQMRGVRRAGARGP